MIIKDITNIVIYRNHREYEELCDAVDDINLKLKELDLLKLTLEQQKLELEMRIGKIERDIASMIMKGQ